METAEKQVTDVVKVDIHLDYTADGKRYIDRISEIVQLEEGVPYPEYDLNDPDNSMNKITAEYYRRKTDRVGFVTRLILKYNLDTHTYEVRDRFSPYLEEKLRGALGEELRVAYDEFMLREWGPRTDDEEIIISQISIQKQLKEYEEKLAAIDKKYADEEARQDAREAEFRAMKETDSADAIQAESALKGMWAQGYIPDSDIIPEAEFSIGSFFDDDLYS